LFLCLGATPLGDEEKSSKLINSSRALRSSNEVLAS
jgi:hypothetical protein